MIPKCKEEKNLYSTEEQVVGKWIDGKPLYRKTIYIEETNISANIIFVEPNIENIEKYINIYGNAKVYDNQYFKNGVLSQIPRIVPDSTANYSIGVDAYSPTKINIQLGTAYVRVSNFELIIEYTKTTD